MKLTADEITLQVQVVVPNQFVGNTAMTDLAWDAGVEVMELESLELLIGFGSRFAEGVTDFERGQFGRGFGKDLGRIFGRRMD